MLQTAIVKEEGGSRYVEFARLSENTVSRTQIEFKKGRIYMRTKRRTYVFT